MENKNKFNLFKLLQNVAIFGIMLIVGIVVLFATRWMPLNNVFVEFAVVVGLLLIGVLLVLPWAKYLEEKQYKIASIVFLAATGVCVVLWEICAMIIFHFYRAKTIDLSIVHLVRITLIISFQVLVASFIGKFVIKYRAKYIPFQAIAYLSLAFIDLFASVMLSGIIIKDGDINYSQDVLMFAAKLWPILALSFVYLGIVYGIIVNSRKRRVRNAILAKDRKLNQDIGLIDLGDDDEEDEKPAKSKADDVEAQLEKLKSMLDKGLITQEQYDAKRQSILEKM